MTLVTFSKKIQLVQNNMLQLINGSKISERVSIESMLSKFGMLSVNQINASIKLLEMWKSFNTPNYPLQVKQQSSGTNKINTRADLRCRPIEIGKRELTKNTCVSDAVRVWNLAPSSVTSSQSVNIAKKEIKTFVRSLPI